LAYKRGDIDSEGNLICRFTFGNSSASAMGSRARCVTGWDVNLEIGNFQPFMTLLTYDFGWLVKTSVYYIPFFLLVCACYPSSNCSTIRSRKKLSGMEVSLRARYLLDIAYLIP